MNENENLCPVCGQPPTATSQNAETGGDVFECVNAHVWGPGADQS